MRDPLDLVRRTPGRLAAALILLFALPACAQFGSPSFVWYSAGPSNSPARITGLVADPTSASGLYLSAAGGGLWRSPDLGTSWASLTDTAPTVQICTFTLDPNNAAIIYAGTGDEHSVRPNQGVMRSSDGGVSWAFPRGFSSQPVCGLVVDPANSNHLLAGSQAGIFQSNDAGTTWSQVSTEGAYGFTIDPNTSGVVYAAVSSPNFLGNVAAPSPLLKSTDGGSSWNHVALPTIDPTLGRLFLRSAVALGDRGVIYLAISYSQIFTTSLDLYRSTDGGATWALSPRVAAASAGGRLPMYYDSVNRYLYIGTSAVVRAAADLSTASVLKTATVTSSNALVLTSSGVVIAGDTGLDNVPLPSAGVTATSLNLPPLGQFLSVLTDPLNSAVIYAGAEDGLRIAGTTSGWKRVLTTGVGSVQVSGGSPQNIYAMGNQSLFRSTDGGTTFKSSTAISSGEFRAPYPPLLMDPVAPSILYTAGQRLYRSADNGQTWAALGPAIDADSSTVVVALAFPAVARQIIYAATACLNTPSSTCQPFSRIFASANSGGTFTQIATVQGYVNKLVVDPQVPQLVYAVTGSFPGGPSNVAGSVPGDIFSIRAVGGTTGVVVSSLRGNLPALPLNALAVPSAGNTVSTTPVTTYYTGGDAGVFATFNSGTSWVALNASLPPVPVTDLSFNTNAGLRAATYGRAIYAAATGTIAHAPVISTLAFNISVVQGQTASVNLSLSNAVTGATALDFGLGFADTWVTATPLSGHLDPGDSAGVKLTVDASTLAVGQYRTKATVIRQASAATGAFAQDINITVQVTVPPASLSVVTGDGSSGVAGSTLPLAVVVRDAAGNPVANLPVFFRITSGSGQLNSPSGISDAQGRAGVILTLPAAAGTVKVTATAGGLAANITVTVLGTVLLPSLSSGAAVNAASFAAGAPVAVGSIVSIFGSNLATGSASAAKLPLGASLNNTRVLIGGTVAPLFFVSPAQINFLVPFEATIGTSGVMVEATGANGAVNSNPVDMTVVAAAPGIFTLTSDGQGLGIFVKADGTLVKASNPAKAGSVVTLYATGLGAVNPPVASGFPAPPAPSLSQTVATPVVNIGGSDATLLFSGLAPGFAGLYQLNIRVPATLAPGSNLPATLRIGTTVSQTVTIAVN